MNKPSIYGLTIDQLIAWLEAHGQKKSRAAKVWEYLYRQRVSAFEEMTELNADCAALLEEHFTILSLEEHLKQESLDGTIKFLFRLRDGNLIETVLMRQKFGLSVCVTTQVGCNIGCSFCASGLLKKSRDLSSGEIMEQIMKVQHHFDQVGEGELVTNVVVMGIGEPFDNFDNLVSVLSIMTDHKGLAIAPRRVTVSTSGLPDKIKDFADLKLPVSLALSLHAPNNELRTQIMKINRAYPIEMLMEALDYYWEKTKRRVMLEYILLRGINDHEKEARELAELLKDRSQRLSVNLIPYNPVDEHSQYQRSSQESVLAFYDILKQHGINCTRRMEHGTDIDAACGQLRSKQMKS
ncbi:23S rRNA (adenine(2503)-C(2))-methyltransferase RlmN [Paenibacillus aquistagni]|uniref:Probable dual-specificity RNA methyltransferase RlmN n=1 Tax=Paenibacillus aquistagni TaxID=1852522 RepID=A0A1X7KPV6_9BACL|nr:23S rRNA (adenine(2503)-C(2))-methyltransferase RlmN [Paenibacillus aquistagni]SMG42747.1 23S rRNA (adenine2503-C2)-methyltransferase [Paenibacillus aquistagni]